MVRARARAMVWARARARARARGKGRVSLSPAKLVGWPAVLGAFVVRVLPVGRGKGASQEA